VFEKGSVEFEMWERGCVVGSGVVRMRGWVVICRGGNGGNGDGRVGLVRGCVELDIVP